MMQYAQARNQIQSGDVLGVRARSLFSRITNFVQWLGGFGPLSGITHVGMAWWVEGRLYAVEMDGRHNVLRPLSQHIQEGCGVDVYRHTVALTDLQANYDRATSAPIKYSTIELFKIGLRVLTRIRLKDDGEGQMVCSTFVARWLQWAGWIPPNNFPSMPSPAEVCKAMEAQNMVVIRVEGK